MSRNVPILLYHRVGDPDGSFMDEFTVSPAIFAEQMDWIRRNGWHPTTLENVVAPGVSLPKRSLVITFDDGFASNREHAWPVLRRHGFPSATFIVTERLGSYNRWDGPTRDSYPLLSSEEVALADAGLMTFHSHSATHPDLRSLADDWNALRKEVEHSRDSLASVKNTGRFFAYPFGCWSPEVVDRVAKAGYLGACTCIEGLNSPYTNPYLLRRVEIHESDVGWKLWLKLYLGRDILRRLRVRMARVSHYMSGLRRNRNPDAEPA
jgi:peptidoglycan/xylan/chitin deacetylase (PgdA/CDA1 family)